MKRILTKDIGKVIYEEAGEPSLDLMKSTLAEGQKAKKGVEAAMDFMEGLVNEILSKFPPGKLPPADKITQRSKEEIEAVIKGPLKGGKHIYTICYPT